MITLTKRWTESKARLTPIRTLAGGNYNWLFLPGGPGLGSESLRELTELLHLPGTVWHLDLPGDGSNVTEDDTKAFSQWSQALIEATAALENVILVGHSMGGMFALSTPELETQLKGLVIMASAPNASFRVGFAEYCKDHPLPNAMKLQAEHDANPSNEIFKKLTMAYAPYMSTPSGQQAMLALMETLPFNNQPYLWAANHFHQTYQAKWIPKAMPVLIFAGDEDYLTPLGLFSDLPEFQRENILIRNIPNASHFPWLENPGRVREVFEEYCGGLS
jgi:pimeloyl-ACP methyl ester carboxylesterase